MSPCKCAMTSVCYYFIRSPYELYFYELHHNRKVVLKLYLSVDRRLTRSNLAKQPRNQQLPLYDKCLQSLRQLTRHPIYSNSFMTVSPSNLHIHQYTMDSICRNSTISWQSLPSSCCPSHSSTQLPIDRYL